MPAAGADWPSSGCAHSPQKRTAGSFALPHDGHTRAKGAAHSPQNLRPALFSAPQFEQILTAKA
jgi:hypothetical protein